MVTANGIRDRVRATVEVVRECTGTSHAIARLTLAEVVREEAICGVLEAEPTAA
jgi:hypothetical protein